jgi:hypothetical protein
MITQGDRRTPMAESRIERTKKGPRRAISEIGGHRKIATYETATLAAASAVFGRGGRGAIRGCRRGLAIPPLDAA